MAATSIFFIFIIASKARFAAAWSFPAVACVSTTGVICHDRPQRSLHLEPAAPIGEPVA